MEGVFIAILALKACLLPSLVATDFMVKSGHGVCYHP
jgi:hypothetical protein